MTKQCFQCHKTFHIYPEDLEFYKKMDVPIPVLCPDCRKQRRITWRNERCLYERICDFSKKKILSVYSPEKPYKVYENKIWWSEQWDAKKYSRDFDFNKTFFEQFAALYQIVPKLSMMVNSVSENCDYSLYLDIGKNCYLCVSGAYLENCHYCYFCQESKNCIDCSCSRRSELCYYCVDCIKCYHVFNGHNCVNCIDCKYLFNCFNCHNCIGCSGLRNKEYYIFNKSYSQEEFFNKSTKLNDKEILENFLILKEKEIRRYYEGTQNINSFGNYLSNCKNAYNCFDVENIEDSSYLINGMKAKDVYDSEFFWSVELCYECLSMYQNNNCLFNDFCWTCNNTAYSSYCFDSQNLFGCCGLKKEKNCILNKQYSENEYQLLRQKIIKHMQKTNEWGKFFPISMCPFAYNESIAYIYYPLAKAEIERRGWKWKVRDEKDYQPASGDILACTKCKKNYKLIQDEIIFYKKNNLNFPNKCPACRFLERIVLRNPRTLWYRQCMCTQPDHHHHGQCTNEFETTYSPERKELIYCEDCYNKEVY